MTKYDLHVEYACIKLSLRRIAAVNISAEETQHCMFTQKAVCMKGRHCAVQRSFDLKPCDGSCDLEHRGNSDCVVHCHQHI